MPSLRVRSGKQGEVQHRKWADCHMAPAQLAILPWESARLPTAPAFPAMNLPVQLIPLTTVRCGDYARCFSFGGETAAHTRPAFRLAFPLHRSGLGLGDEGQTPGQHAVSAGTRSILPPVSSASLGLDPPRARVWLAGPPCRSAGCLQLQPNGSHFALVPLI
uniref:Uncharacterized protein n=1 Tax=Pipistrellus kuhlii TaxID=59472 RepID=A0A7J8A8K2_PIPKU|nr:hypothetical protein mPipKuh1_008860 [Pipistrellus kuhlii]